MHPSVYSRMCICVCVCVCVCANLWLCVTAGMGDSTYFYVHMIFALNGVVASAIALLGTYLRYIHVYTMPGCSVSCVV